MQIGIDLSPLTYTMTGIGVYVQQLVREASILFPELRWTFPVVSEVPSRTFFRLRMRNNLEDQYARKVTIDPRFSLLHDRRQNRKPCVLEKKSLDIFHVTNTQSQFDKFEMPYVITVHDLAWMRVPKSELPTPRIFGLNKLEGLIRNADHVICDSECTRADVLELVGRDPQNVTTVHLAPRPMFCPPISEQARSDSRRLATDGRPYFFAVSTIEPRKNYVRLAQAFAALREQLPDHQLLIAGAKRAAWPSLRRVIQETRMTDRIRVLGRVSDTTILKLLWGCEALLYPSLYEGFGLPALEAMACGTPVICSAAGSLGEVVGNAALIVDPLKVESIADAMLAIARSTALADDLRRQSLSHSRGFSWSKTAQQTVAVYEKLIVR